MKTAELNRIQANVRRLLAEGIAHWPLIPKNLGLSLLNNSSYFDLTDFSDKRKRSKNSPISLPNAHDFLKQNTI